MLVSMTGCQLHYNFSQQICLLSNSVYVPTKASRVFVLLLQPPTLTLPPPYDPQYKLQDGKSVTQELRETLTAMIKQMNDAISSLLPLSAATAAA